MPPEKVLTLLFRLSHSPTIFKIRSIRSIRSGSTEPGTPYSSPWRRRFIWALR
jgi:hypothetical protein